ncbi:collagen-binding protein [Bacteroidia bacterium]|nr:collagen-binding protein [Bacteroidia bacterium]
MSPAVELIKKVIERKEENRIENHSAYQVSVYDKLTLSLDRFNPDPQHNFLLRKFPFLRNHWEVSEFNGQPVLPLSLREKLSEQYYRKDAILHKTVVIAQNHLGVDKTFDEDGTISYNLEKMFRGINIYDNNLTILFNQFVSPLSSLQATGYYEYSMVDTVYISGKSYINLSFVPVNRQSYGFTGYLQIDTDSYSVKKIQMETSRNLHLNGVEKMRIEQTFQDLPDGTKALSTEHIYADFSPIETAPPLYAHLFRCFTDYNLHPTDGDTIPRFSGNWAAGRPYPLTEKEEQLAIALLLMNDDSFYRTSIKALEILLSGYIPTRRDSHKSRFDIGPTGSTFSSNDVEGFRLRVGGVTTAKLHPQWFAGGYLAYGMKDRQLKYQLKITHSFDKKKQHEWERPIHHLSITHRYDIFTPGGNLPFGDNDNLFNSIKSGAAETQMQYIRKTELRYEKEWRNGLSVNAWLRHEKNEAAGTLRYDQYAGDKMRHLPGFTTALAGLQLRFAPVFSLAHQYSFKGLLGSDFACHFSELKAEKRLGLSSFGHIDVLAKAGKVWNSAPFPLLILPDANQSIFIHSETFMMMRSLEFVADEYAAIYATCYLKGWILNRIPIVNRLKLREVLSANLIYGQLTDKNNPQKNQEGLFRLPDATRPFGEKPYVEVSVGIDNIFKILRVDYYRRLTCLDDPDIQQWGLRLAFRFSF